MRPGKAGSGRQRTESSGRKPLGIDFAGVQQLGERCHPRLLLLVLRPGRILDQSQTAAVRGETAVGVIDAQVQPELGSRGEHTVGLVGAL